MRNILFFLLSRSIRDSNNFKTNILKGTGSLNLTPTNHHEEDAPTTNKALMVDMFDIEVDSLVIKGITFWQTPMSLNEPDCIQTNPS